MAEQASAEFLRLLQLARESSTQSRAELIDSLGEFIGQREELRNPRERQLISEILSRLLKDAEISVRRRLAERLAREPDAPLDLIIQLAGDEIDVARPVLLDNVALRDQDLIELVEHRTMQHRLAIAMRQMVSEPVSAALVEAGEDDVARALLENPGARIDRPSYAKLVTRSQGSTVLQEPLLNRQDLDVDLAERMYGWVSVALRRHIVQNFDVDPKLLDDAIRDALRTVNADHARQTGQGASNDRIARALADSRGEDPAMLLNLLRAGEVGLFEALFARMTGLRTTLARRAIYEPGGRPLAVACRASGIQKPIFAAIFLLARQARPGDKSVDPKELPNALSFFDALEETAARTTLDKLRAGAPRTVPNAA
jgi:uncharacterized protein (DUF2336 family)